jgi:uncharacterized membrane protein
MTFIFKTLFKGLATVLPVVLTAYLIYWLTISIEQALKFIITAVIPASYYWPGMGFLLGLTLLFLIGIAVKAWPVQQLLQYSDDLINRIPLVKSIYSALKDFMDFFSSTKDQDDIRQVVLVTIGEMRLIGSRVRVAHSPPLFPSGKQRLTEM